MLKNHPRGLMVLFFTEMWERFGFYILMAIFVLYMDEKIGWDDARKADYYGWFLGAVYFIPILGGYIADRWLGARNTIQIGAILMTIGYASLALSSRDSLEYFYTGLILVAFGTGIFKVNMSVLVGNLYAPDDPRKDSGYNIYYMGVNLGATIAPLAATLIHNVFDSYNLSFAAAGIGMALSIAVFNGGRKHLRGTELKKNTETGEEKPSAGNAAEDRQRIIVLVTLFAIVIFFWIAFYQNGFAMTLFAQRATMVYGFLKPETYQFFNPFFILLVTPLLVSVFARMRVKGKEPSTATKIFSGMCVSGFAMVVMVFASMAGGNLDNNTMSPWWLIGSYFVTTIAEILVSPMGLSFVSKVAPKKIQGVMMGLWFGGTAIGSYGSGLLGRLYGLMPHHQYYMIIASLLFVAAFLVLLSLKKLNRFSVSS